MIRARRARIVATLGPASRQPEQVLALAIAGADVFRLNFSHGSHEDHAETAAAVRQAEATTGRPLGILADLQGPKLRLGRFKDGAIAVQPGYHLRLDLDPTPGDETRVSMPHPELFAAMRAGVMLLVDDGKVRLRVLTCSRDAAEVEVVQGERLSDRKGVALPGAVIPMPALTPKDHKDLAFALRLGVDWIALSFVQSAADMAELRKIVQGRAACLAKIEKPAALDDLDAILDLCDGVMVARGDLGVELEPEEVPVAQKQILRAARSRGVPAIVATQMLDSMTINATPTRAEASDVANAVYEGADALMLSAESASGLFPLESVTMMNRIIERVERDPRWPELISATHPADDHDADILVAAARRASEAGSSACLVSFTSTGWTARLLARERPLQPVLALTPDPRVARRLALVWGLEPRVASDPDGLDEMTAEAVQMAVNLGMARPGERVLIVAGTPFGAPGSANLLRLAHAPPR
ncbi:MAG TPA: pyruvate kinase [Caulobacteraceae bacterium]|jgi:pyruvate kinase|nr:pyruvate kinase [Caulobacteraceae bacterium]